MSKIEKPKKTAIPIRTYSLEPKFKLEQKDVLQNFLDPRKNPHLKLVKIRPETAAIPRPKPKIKEADRNEVITFKGELLVEGKHQEPIPLDQMGSAPEEPEDAEADEGEGNENAPKKTHFGSSIPRDLFRPFPSTTKQKQASKNPNVMLGLMRKRTLNEKSSVVIKDISQHELDSVEFNQSSTIQTDGPNYYTAKAVTGRKIIRKIQDANSESSPLLERKSHISHDHPNDGINTNPSFVLQEGEEMFLGLGADWKNILKDRAKAGQLSERSQTIQVPEKTTARKVTKKDRPNTASNMQNPYENLMKNLLKSQKSSNDEAQYHKFLRVENESKLAYMPRRNRLNKEKMALEQDRLKLEQIAGNQIPESESVLFDDEPDEKEEKLPAIQGKGLKSSPKKGNDNNFDANKQTIKSKKSKKETTRSRSPNFTKPRTQQENYVPAGFDAKKFMNSLNLDTSLVLKKEDPEARKAQPISKGNKTSTRSEEVIGIHFRVQSTKAPNYLQNINYYPQSKPNPHPFLCQEELEHQKF